jgi:hypothetical protein
MKNNRPKSAPRRGALETAALFITIGFVAVVAGACSEEFTSYELLTGTRLLAVRADNPSLSEGEMATLDALVFTASGEEVSYRWSWCPVQGNPSDGFVCPITDSDLERMLPPPADGADPFPSLNLGSGEVAELPYPGDRALVAGLCEAIRSQPHPTHMTMPTCSRGLDVYVKVEIVTPTTTVTAIKEVELLIEPDAEPNTNPILEGLDVSAVGLETELVGDELNELPAASPFALSLRMADGSVESFQPAPTPDDPSPTARDEKPMFTWFVEAGELDFTRTGVVDGTSSVDDAIHNVWRLGASGAEVDFVVVVRDGRGGMDWAQRRVRVSE